MDFVLLFRQRDCRIYCEIVGYGLSADGHHITAGKLDGSGVALAMKAAFKVSQCVIGRSFQSSLSSNLLNIRF